MNNTFLVIKPGAALEHVFFAPLGIFSFFLPSLNFLRNIFLILHKPLYDIHTLL